MDLFEKINRAFGSWYEGLFGPGDDVRPRDILRLLLTALEEHRKEGIDNRVYVPNRYILEIAVSDAEEKDYLYAFLDRDELEMAIRQYCKQNNYHVRGVLDFTIIEKEVEATSKAPPKIRVRCRYDPFASKSQPPPAAPETPQPLPEREPDELATVAGSVSSGDPRTLIEIPRAFLEVHVEGALARTEPLLGGSLAIGRSSRAGNNLVISGDGLLSRRHARIEMDADGRFTLYDLNTTNGTRVNGERIENRTLKDGDEILVGRTRLRFLQADPELQAVAPAPPDRKPPRLVLLRHDAPPETFVLAAETMLGRSPTNDVVLDDRSVATRHARITLGDVAMIENMAASEPSFLNDRAMAQGDRKPLREGDSIRLGTFDLRFEEGPRL